MDLQQLQLRNQQLSILNSIAQDLNREVELEKAMAATLRQTVHLLNLSTGWIWLTNPESNNAYIAASYNLPPVFAQKPQLLSGDCYCLSKYLTGTLADASNISEITCTRLQNLSEGTEGLRYHASVPLFGRTSKLGIMNVLSADSQQLSDEQLKMLYTIGDMLSITIERGRLFENSRQLGIMQERNRLAREIHDTLAQGLSGISLKLETAQAFLEQGNHDKVGQLLEHSLQLTKHNLEESRRSVLDLRSAPLDRANLVDALEKLLQELLDSSDMNTRFEVRGTHRNLDPRIELGLFRIGQEALNNVLKHAQAQKCRLTIEYTAEGISLKIEDDGIGFEAGQGNDGFGLIGISERVHLLKGKLKVKSQPGLGTKIEVFVMTN